MLSERRLAGSSSLRAAVARLADDPDLRVRFQLALVLGEFPGDDASPALAAIARRDAGDPWVRTAVLSAETASPAALFESLWRDRSFAASPAGVSLLRPLALTVGARGRAEEVGRVLGALAAGGPEDSALDVALGLGDGISRARYYPGVQKIKVKLLAEPGSLRLIGAQMVGGGEGIKERADFLAQAVRFGLTLHDLSTMENVYSPAMGALNERADAAPLFV